MFSNSIVRCYALNINIRDSQIILGLRYALAILGLRDTLAQQIDRKQIPQAERMTSYLKIASKLMNFGVEYFRAILQGDRYQDHIPKELLGKPCVFGISGESITIFNPRKKAKQDPVITIPLSKTCIFIT